MKNKRNFKIVILEDDDFYNRILSRYLNKNLNEIGLSKGFTVSISSFTSFKDCTLNLQPDMDILFTDYYLSNGYSAPLIMEKLRQRSINCKVIIISHMQTIQTAVSPIFDGAVDFVKKNSNALKNCLCISETIIFEKLKGIN